MVVVALVTAEGWVGTSFQTGNNKILLFEGNLKYFGVSEPMVKTLFSHWLACVVGQNIVSALQECGVSKKMIMCNG
jgi:hypothetical protein